jgi:hypothetical protein
MITFICAIIKNNNSFEKCAICMAFNNKTVNTTKQLLIHCGKIPSFLELFSRDVVVTKVLVVAHYIYIEINI